MTSKDIEMIELQKCQIRFSSPEGDYEGHVLVVCPVAKKMLVSKILYLPKRLPMGTLQFSFHEILSYTILSKPDASTLKNGDSNRSTYSYAPPRATDMCLLDDCSEVGDAAEIEDNVSLDDLYKEEHFVLKVPPQHASRIPIDNVIFDRIDDEFHQAIKHIYQQDCIGVSLEGPKIGRNGILSWFCVSTSSCSFLFDIETLGERAFQEGLKKILEDRNIEKVLHDCRQASDCLFHKYDTRLVNVFDTQVADLLVTMQRSKDCKFGRHVSSLDSCLRTYLEIPEEYIHKSKVYRTYEDSVVFFRQRPLQTGIREVLLKNVLYLRSLKRELNFALLTPLHRAVEVYLQVLQTATDRELLLESFVPEELPQELIMEGIQIVRFKEYVEVPPVVASGPPYRKLKNPVKDYAFNCGKKGEGFQGSDSSNTDKSGFHANLKLADEPNHHKENASDFVESNRNGFLLKQESDVTTTSEVLTNGKTDDFISTDEMVQKNPSKLKDDTDSSKNIATNVDKSKAIADYINFMRLRRIRRMENNLQSSSLSEESQCSEISSSDSDSEPIHPRKSYQEILIDISNRQEQPIISKEKTLGHSSSDSTDSSDDDPWAPLRAKFNTCDYSAETVKRKIRFYPA